MKKALLILLFALLAAVCFGQEAAHLKFKGIPLDGNYKAFAQKLVQKGFKQIDITGRIVIYLMYFDSHSYVVCSYADDVNVQALRQTILDDI